MFSRDEMQRAIEDALKTMEGIALELYRRGREEAREELETVKRERDEWRNKFHALNQTAGELCDACGWAFKIPGDPCRCEVVRERDEARADAERYLADLRRCASQPYEHAEERADAYRRGAEAMREACIGYCHKIGFHGLTVDIRALPIPEEP